MATSKSRCSRRSSVSRWATRVSSVGSEGWFIALKLIIGRRCASPAQACSLNRLLKNLSPGVLTLRIHTARPFEASFAVRAGSCRCSQLARPADVRACSLRINRLCGCFAGATIHGCVDRPLKTNCRRYFSSPLSKAKDSRKYSVNAQRCNASHR